MGERVQLVPARCPHGQRGAAAISRYDLASRQTVEGTQENLLTPGVFTDVFERFLTGLQKQDASGETGVGMGSAAYMLYSDYSAGYGREQSVLAVQAALNKAKAAGRGLTGVRANAYVWAYADCLTALPLASSRYNIEDESVPFLQMVLKGCIPYSTPSVNQADDPQEIFLQAAETGSGLLFTLIGGEAQLTRDTVYAAYTSASAARLDRGRRQNTNRHSRSSRSRLGTAPSSGTAGAVISARQCMRTA